MASPNIQLPRSRSKRLVSVGSVGAQSLSLALVGKQSPNRRAVELSIMQKFERTYGAHLEHFLPDLIGLEISGELGAVVGMRSARDNDLFLEQYLDQPVEQAVAGAFMTPVDRDSIVEIGNLAANVPRLAYSLFAVLATVLSRAGYRWVACTATPQVASMLTRMNFSAAAICRADESRLESGSVDWGTYYSSRPQVMAGDANLAAEQVLSNPALAGLIRRYHQPITQMAASLKSASK
ncbi:MAG: hypothetical protein ACI8XW_003595 [Gammaproteobacteria bacterium]|jgi:hypothetical protein